MVVRHIRDEDYVAHALKITRRGVADVQRPTGTEKLKTANVAQQALNIGTTAKNVADQAADDVLAAALAANQAYNLAYQNSLTVDGMRRVVASIAQPAEPANGWVNGDQWWEYEVEPVTGRNRLRNVWIWNGSDWALFQFIADSVLVPSSVGNVLLAEGAVDAMTITGAQIYGGYIEAPVMASSDKLGTGANALNDPLFQSTVDTSWVASGHLGDTVTRRQTDNISWDQTWQQEEWSYPGGYVNHGVRNWGSVIAHGDVSPDTSGRSAGSLLFSNISWVPTTARTLTDPYTFVNRTWLQMDKYQPGGRQDPTFTASHGAPAYLAGTARTTYLTNSATVAVVAGERWNARLGFTRLSTAQAANISGMYLEVINAATSAVLWSVQLTAEEITAGSVNAWWDSAFTGNVKYRIKVVYTGGGKAKFLRRIQTGSFARRWTKSAMTDEWIRVATDAMDYGGQPRTVAEGSYMTMPGNWASRAFDMKATSAVFAKVEPEKGWRLTADGGLELFNSLGAKTGQLDGEDNFISGRLGTAESGIRWELQGDTIKLYSAANAVLAEIKRNGTQLEIAAGSKGLLVSGGGGVKETGDTDWVIVGNASGSSPRAKYRRRNGLVEVTGQLSRTAGSYGVFQLPSGFRPAGTIQFNNPNNGIYEITSNGWISTGNANQTICDFDIRFEPNGS